MVETTPTKALSPTQNDIKPISFLGKNEKSILIIINEKETAYLAEKDLNLLTGILSACQLSLADVALVNFDKNNGIDYNQLMENFSPALVLLFGISPQELSFPLHFPVYQLQQYNQQTYLYSASLNVLGADVDQKKLLWASLQKHFNKN